jgi:15-cis-phytoene synthase
MSTGLQTVTATDVDAGRASLKKHAKSFQFAAWFLPTDSADAAAVLYRFCREVDDAIDDATDEAAARAEATALIAEMKGQRTARPAIAAFQALAARENIDVRYAHDLVAGVVSDVTRPLYMADDAALLRYCYQVAGTVGGMMSPLLGVSDPAATRHAIDLGTAMQLTNICRDVLEDAARLRCYLPRTRLHAPFALPALPARSEVQQVVRQLLATADEYYASGRAGLRYIPWRTRVAIAVAAEVYRSIGTKLLRQGGDPTHGRVHTTKLEKVAAAVRALWWLVSDTRRLHQRASAV